MSNLLRTFLCGAAVLAANPAFAQLSFQGGGSSIIIDRTSHGYNGHHDHGSRRRLCRDA